jgi:hypothetical protein
MAQSSSSWTDKKDIDLIDNSVNMSSKKSLPYNRFKNTYLITDFVKIQISIRHGFKKNNNNSTTTLSYNVKLCTSTYQYSYLIANAKAFAFILLEMTKATYSSTPHPCIHCGILLAGTSLFLQKCQVRVGVY